MNEKNDKWLDEIIFKTINTSKPQFDVEEFKQKFPDEMKILKLRASQKQRLSWWRTILSDPISSLATAAVIIIMIGIFVFFSQTNEISKPPVLKNVEKSPAEMLTLRSLNSAYYEGGIEAVESQCDTAIEHFKPESNKITINELIAEING